MAVTNLLDRLAEEYEGTHPVEYRAPLAKIGKAIGGKGFVLPKIYTLGGGTKGASARDIIRMNRKGEGEGVYPLDVLEAQRNNKRIDESKPWDYAIQGKDGGMLLNSFDGGTKAEAKEYLKRMKEKGIVPKDAKLLSNVSSSRRTASQKRDLDEFYKAFEDVRKQRDFRNEQGFRGDYLSDANLSYDKNESLGNLKQSLYDKRHRRRNFEFTKKWHEVSPTSGTTYSVDSWDKWLDAKTASKEAGQKLGRLFAVQNQLEKNMYGNISKGLNPSTNPVPEGRYKYALGNQNHVYSERPDETENYKMPLVPNYPRQPALTNSGHKIHWLNDGTPIIDAFTWTQIPNIENIKKTGYLAIEGADTENFHSGVKGHWTSDKDNTPMGKNYENDIHIGEIGPNGETFDEELLHSRIPLNWFQKAPVIHQGPRGSNFSVDVIQAKPGAPEVMIGEGRKRRLEKVATPPQFINHIPADKMRPDWTMGSSSNFDYTSQTIPGWHPNKPYVGYTTERAIGRLVPNETLVKMKDEMSKKERVNWFLDQLKDEEGKKAFYQSVLNYENPLADKSEGLQKDALKQFYENPELENKTAYDIVKMVENPPKVNVGSVTNGTKTPNVWTRVLNGKDFPRTKKYISQQMIDNKPLSRFHYGTHYYTGNLLDIKDSPLQKAFPFGDWKFGQLNIGPNINDDLFFPEPSEAAKYEEKYLKDVAGNVDKYIRERKSYPDRPEDAEIDHKVRQNHKKYMLYELQQNRSKDVVNQIWPKWMKMSANPETHKFDSNAFRDVAEFTKDSPYGTKSGFSFEDWFNDYKKQYGSAAVEKQRIKPVVDLYLEELKNQPSNKELAKIVIDNAPKVKEEKILADDYKKYMKADSLDKVIGHTIGRRIGADRAKRGKKIF